MIKVIGIGPGGRNFMTYDAVAAIEEAEVIVGYVTYTKLIEDLIVGKEVVSNGMRKEKERCAEAIRIARTGKKVAVISSGDSGIYGMAGLMLELSNGEDEIEIIPGVTAAAAGASILGAPLMHDFCFISMSDLLTPYDLIMKRVEKAAEGDFIMCIYNPKSKGRPDHLKNAFDIIKKVQGDDLVVGYVRNIAREGQYSNITTISEINYEEIDMTTVVLVGNSKTFEKAGKMITPRGYTV